MNLNMARLRVPESMRAFVKIRPLFVYARVFSNRLQVDYTNPQTRHLKRQWILRE